jgi:hypothetical protein
MFDLFDFTPVEGDPFQAQARPEPETWAHYAGNPEHPMLGRVGSGMVELARQKALGLKNALETFVGPMYGQGHVPMAGENGTEYAGAGFGLANLLGGGAPEGALSAGWNPRALGYLNGLLKQKPALKPETASAVKDLLANGPEHLDTMESNAPGKGFGTLAKTLHDVEEKQKQDAAKNIVASTPLSLEEVMGLSGPKPTPNNLVPSSVVNTDPLGSFVGQNELMPHANDQSSIADYSARVSTPDMVELHRQDVEAVSAYEQSLRALQQLKEGRPPMNYDEAQVLQQGLDDKIQKLTYSLNQAKLDVAARAKEIERRRSPSIMAERTISDIQDQLRRSKGEGGVDGEE